MNRISLHRHRASAVIAILLLGASLPAHATAQDTELQTREAILNLIGSLVKSGTLSREAADKVIGGYAPMTAEEMALQNRNMTQNLITRLMNSGVLSRQEVAMIAAPLEAPPAVPHAATAMVASAPANAGGIPVTGSAPATAPSGPPTVVREMTPAEIKLAQMPAPAPEIGPDGKQVVRVRYVPDSVKADVARQVKDEVVAQAKAERWGDRGALPDWLNRIQIEGDVRLRGEGIKMGADNTPAGALENFPNGVLFTRAPDIVGAKDPYSYASLDTQDGGKRIRLRTRLGFKAAVSDMVTAGMTFSTGNTTNRVSTNQTLGQNFNKYSVVLDRGYIKVDPAPWASFSGGRIANPFLSTDLVWSDDLNFEGVAATFKAKMGQSANAFFTMGRFLVREYTPGVQAGRGMMAWQAGGEMKFGEKRNGIKAGVAVYAYRNVEGYPESDDDYHAYSLSGYDRPGYVTRSEYGDGLRQRGNTLFVINAPHDPNVNWGLASKFREMDFNAVLDIAQFDPFHIILTADYVKNMAYDPADILKRTGYTIEDGRYTGGLAKVQIGAPVVAKARDWNASLTYRYLGSDAVLDAFTNSDFGLGGTNNKGTILGFNLGVGKNAWISTRWMSSDILNPWVPKYDKNTPVQSKFGVDIFQIDFNTKF